MRATPPSLRMSAGTLSRAMTAAAPAASATRAWSALVTSMMTPPTSIRASPTFSSQCPIVSCRWLSGISMVDERSKKRSQTASERGPKKLQWKVLYNLRRHLSLVTCRSSLHYPPRVRVDGERASAEEAHEGHAGFAGKAHGKARNSGNSSHQGKAGSVGLLHDLEADPTAHLKEAA